MTATDLKKKLTERGIKQQFVANSLDVSKTLVSRWVNATTPIPTKHITALKALLK